MSVTITAPINNFKKTTAPGWNYIFQLKRRDVTGIISNYYTNQTMVDITRSCHGEKKYTNLKLFYKYLKQVKVLQFKVEDVEIDNEITAFKLLLITKNKSNRIDFTEHSIINKWKNRKIIEHQHTIISH